jgi:hypothetical protein
MLFVDQQVFQVNPPMLPRQVVRELAGFQQLDEEGLGNSQQLGGLVA